MKKNSTPTDDLPATLKYYVHVLKTESPPLRPKTLSSLQTARRAALERHASQSGQSWLTGPLAVLDMPDYSRSTWSWLSLGALLMLIAVLWAGRASTDDAWMLGDDVPIDALVDNGFEPWQQNESNN